MKSFGFISVKKKDYGSLPNEENNIPVYLFWEITFILDVARSSVTTELWSHFYPQK